MWSVWLVFCDCGFHSVCPLMSKDKKLMEASWWEKLTVGGTGSCSDVQGPCSVNLKGNPKRKLVNTKEISPEYSLEGLMLKLKLQCFGQLMQRTDSLEKTLMLGKIEGGRKKRWQRMRWLNVITDSMDMSLGRSRSWWWTGKPSMLQSMGLQRVRHDWVAELKWTELVSMILVELHLS